MDKNSYPKFIKNTPHGEDRYEGKSAERTAKAIKKHIIQFKSDKNLPKIIGLEGSWGSGKSNIIRLLKRELGDKYYIFEYDAWGHQEDLQRRAFLETLTYDLLNAEKGSILQEYCSKRNSKNEVEKWSKKLENLLARKRSTETITNPRISPGMIGAILIFVFTPISSIIADDSSLGLGIKILISLIPLILAILAWGIYSILKKKIIWDELFEIYSPDNIIKTVNESISEKEPTVKEFTDWMKDLSEDIIKKELVIVFDNMDRLPAEKVKELWSSIHTFFSDKSYNNISVIIPFDRPHLANAFGENEKQNSLKAKELTCHFINKTFPVVYRVSPPVMTDWKKIFHDFFTDAFGENKEYETIQRIFGILKKDFTPRDIIAFINDMVSLKRTWEDEISLIPIAVFSLKKEEILKSPSIQILSKSYLQSIEKIVDDSDELQIQISALTYGVDIELAKQIPLMQYLNDMFKGQLDGDVNKYSENIHFNEILDEVIKDIDLSFINNVIIKLSNFSSTKNKITLQWNQLVNMSLNIQLNTISLEETHKILMLNADTYHKRKLLNYICRSFEKNENFEGDIYYSTLNSLENFLVEHKIELNLDEFIKSKKTNPQTFINYANAAKENYLRFKLVCDNEMLSNYIISLFPSKLPKLDFLDYVKNDENYSFKLLVEKIEKTINANELDANNFPTIIKAYKTLSKSRPLEVQLNSSQIQALYSSLPDKSSDAFIDICAMLLAHQITTIPHKDGLDERIADRIEFYKEYGDLLKICTLWDCLLLRNSVKIMTEKSFGLKLAIKETLPIFNQIVSSIKVSPELLLEELNNWPIEDEATDFDTIITDYSFFDHSTKVKNELTEKINQSILVKIENLSIEDLYSQRNIVSSFWLNSISIFIKSHYILTYPKNINEFCKLILKDIASNQLEIPSENSILDIILKKADKKNLHHTIKDITTDYCNKTYTITPNLFIFFSVNFDFINKVSQRDGDISSFILNQVISNDRCIDHILNNSHTYINIINNSGDDANDLKYTIKEKLTMNYSENLEKFCNSIGIYRDEEVKEN